MLHLIELPLNLRDLHVWAGSGRFKGNEFDEGVALHHLLGEVFGPGCLQPFRLMVSPGARDATLYAYADRDADALRTAAMVVLTPGQAQAIRLDRLRSLPRPPETWQAGMRLGFDVRLRPVVRLRKGRDGTDDAGRPVRMSAGAEVDAFLAGALKGEAVSRESVYLDWLADRLGTAARLDPRATRLAGFRRSVVVRDGRRLEGPEAIIHGTLVVADADAFAQQLATGIGRHRSYGYGMLLLRPPQRPVSD